MPRVATYHNKAHGFEIVFPDGWSEATFLTRLFRSSNSGSPEFFGPKEAALKFAIGSIQPAPSIAAFQTTLKGIAAKHGHDVIDIASIDIGGSQHATMLL